MRDEDARHREQVKQCFEEIAELLGTLSSRHPTLVVLAALAEQVGHGLLACHESGACSATRLREILAHMESLAFADKATPQ